MIGPSDTTTEKPLGIAGRLTQAFIKSALTPLFILAALAAGMLAVASLPREEERGHGDEEGEQVLHVIHFAE